MKCYFCKVDLVPSPYAKALRCPDNNCIANTNRMVSLEMRPNGNYIFPIIKSYKINGWIETNVARHELTFFFKKVGIDNQWRSYTMPYMQIQEDNDFDLIIEAVCKSVRKINIFK